MTMRNEMVKAFQAGWALIPLKDNSKLPNLPKGHEFLGRAPSKDEYKNFKWGNYGIVTGPISDICVLDVDGAEGRNSLAKLEVKAEMIRTPQVLTPNGRHLYFKFNPGIATSVGTLGKGLDVRSTGAYVVGPGSVVEGEPYVWDELNDLTVPIADTPLWMFPSAERKAMEDEWELEGSIMDGTRNVTLTRLAGLLLSRGLPRPVIYEMLRPVNLMMCKPPIDDDEVVRIAESVERTAERKKNAQT